MVAELSRRPHPDQPGPPLRLVHEAEGVLVLEHPAPVGQGAAEIPIAERGEHLEEADLGLRLGLLALAVPAQRRQRVPHALQVAAQPCEPSCHVVDRRLVEVLLGERLADHCIGFVPVPDLHQCDDEIAHRRAELAAAPTGSVDVRAAARFSWARLSIPRSPARSARRAAVSKWAAPSMERLAIEAATPFELNAWARGVTPTSSAWPSRSASSASRSPATRLPLKISRLARLSRAVTVSSSGSGRSASSGSERAVPCRPSLCSAFAFIDLARAAPRPS